jgi:GrpB-like predicted nucleotidyltransferase (UPF0157 family)/RimJ/RimL family protein N-acetyltransferase
VTGGFPLETERLVLRSKTLGDLDAMQELYGDPDVAAWLGGEPFNREQTREHLLRHMRLEREHGFATWAVVEQSSGKVIGHCGLQHLDGGPEVEVGWALVPSRWGRGYATEAARASVAWGFEQLGLEEIVAVTRPTNARSRRVMEKLGMTYEGLGVWYGAEQVRYAVRRVPLGPLEVVAYDPAWPLRFEEERARIAEALGSRAPVIEHIGSTSVPGLAAKPVIDVLLGLRSYPLDEAGVRALEGLGYEYRGEFGIPGRQFFRKGEPRSHHVHAVELGSDLWVSHLAFRDRLRDHPEDAARYASLKHELVSRYRDERGRYTEAKAPFIEELLQRAAPR